MHWTSENSGDYRCATPAERAHAAAKWATRVPSHAEDAPWLLCCRDPTAMWQRRAGFPGAQFSHCRRVWRRSAVRADGRRTRADAVRCAAARAVRRRPNLPDRRDRRVRRWAAASSHPRLECDLDLHHGGAGREGARRLRRHNLDVDFINYGGSTEQLLEAIATERPIARDWHGAAVAQADRAGIRRPHHGRRSRRLHTASRLEIRKDRDARVDARQAIGISDQASPAKNFVSIALMKNGIDPIKNV